MSAPFEFLDTPTEDDRSLILAPLMAQNLESGPPPDLRSFAFVLRDDARRINGGLWGRTAYDWAVIELLFVPRDLRGAGIGRSLVEAAETLARERECRGIWLDSFEFQAPGFYRRLGYEVFGELSDNPKGQSRFFLRKMLAQVD